jgi:lambda family phage portal protein
MGIFDRFTKQKSAVVIPRRKPTPSYYRSRVTGLENTWYSINRGFLNSPNKEVRYSLEKTRELSRLLVSIDGYAAKYIELLSVYVVGEQGMQISPQYTQNGVLVDEVNVRITNAWNLWCEEASFDGRYSFKELEQLGIRGVGRDGEALFRIVRGKSVNRFGFALQPLDPGLLDINYNAKLEGEKFIYMGVEYDGVRPVAYHLYNRYADELVTSGYVNRIRERVPADEIIHIFDDDYGNLVRGMPWLQPAIKTMARLHEYLDAHLLACQVAAAAPLVMTSEGADTPDFEDVSVNSVKNGDGTTSTVNQEVAPVINLNYSHILELPANKRLQALDLKYPTQGFDVAVKTYLQQIAAGLQVSYASLTSDSSQESYSTVRHGSIIERDHWKQVQNFYKQRFHKKVYRAWLEAALLTGALDLPGMPEEYYNVEFRPRGFKHADPLKEMRAYVEGIAQGLYTREQIVAEMGGNWEENIRTIQKEQRFAAEHGVLLPEVAAKLEVNSELPQNR